MADSDIGFAGRQSISGCSPNTNIQPSRLRLGSIITGLNDGGSGDDLVVAGRIERQVVILSHN